MTNLHEILERARGARLRLPPNEAAVLFAAAVRLAASQGATLRARLVQIDDSGGLHLAPFDDQAPETEPGYLAPELHGADAPRKSEPRVQVYAAGALGFELLTGHPAPGIPGEPSGPLGDIIRMAMAPDRRERFGDLTQLYDAIEGVQPRPPAEGERNIFAAVRQRWMRMPSEKEAVARIIEKLGTLETQVAALGKSQARLDAAQRQVTEQIERFSEGQARLPAPQQRPGAFVPALLASVLTAAILVGAAWVMGLLSRPAAPAVEPPIAAREPTPPPPPTPVVPREPAHAPDAAVAEEKPAPPAVEMASVPDAGAPDAGAVAAQTPDAGALPPPSPPPAAKRPKQEVSQAAMLHAVAVSQVRRGEASLEQGRADEALESFRAALENEATLATAYRGLGMAYAVQGNDVQALRAYDRYLQLAPSAPDRAEIRKSIQELKSRIGK